MQYHERRPYSSNPPNQRLQPSHAPLRPILLYCSSTYAGRRCVYSPSSTGRIVPVNIETRPRQLALIEALTQNPRNERCEDYTAFCCSKIQSEIKRVLTSYNIHTTYRYPRNQYKRLLRSVVQDGTSIQFATDLMFTDAAFNNLATQSRMQMYNHDQHFRSHM